MSNKTDLQALNTDYAALIDTLRGKAVGGGGEELATCTVNFSGFPFLSDVEQFYQAVENGKVVLKEDIVGDSIEMLCGGMFFGVVSSTYTPVYFSSTSGITLMSKYAYGGNAINILFQADLGAGETGVITYEIPGGCGGFCCFAAGTKVLLSIDGETKNIEDITVGEKVVSYNIETKENYLTEVTRLVVNDHTTDIAEVTFDNGTTVVMNAYHPLYCENGFKSITKFNDYDELVVGDTVKTVDGWTKVININRYESEPIITYNLDVRDIDENPDIDTNDTWYANGIVVKNANANSGHNR